MKKGKHEVKLMIVLVTFVAFILETVEIQAKQPKKQDVGFTETIVSLGKPPTGTSVIGTVAITGKESFLHPHRMFFDMVSKPKAINSIRLFVSALLSEDKLLILIMLPQR